MSNVKKIALLLLVVVIAYWSAWGKTYFLTKSYFDYAVAQEAQGAYVEALKGMNKLELRIEEPYLGGYQQVIEAWDNTAFGVRPRFYYEAMDAPERLLPQLDADTLYEFIDVYVQLDVRYVPEVAHLLMNKAAEQGDTAVEEEMRDFLVHAFPDHKLAQL
ncbi:hypothetical protein [Thaumasiovibrio subtropicus]|uniref:hypothetical protein n=1 Tax=Thaumasiovibrio subtropicus TaxID=1891207 RepID=UPI000B358EC8|nr:hypothetical protein [Thaumasiovibrio subtropicus]